MDPAIQYCLQVINITPPGNSFNKNGETVYSHKVTFIDQHGYTYYGEYLCRDQVQKHFQVNMATPFRVISEDDIMPKIAPVNVAQQVEKVPIIGLVKDIDAKDINLRCLDLAVRIIEAEQANSMNGVKDEDIERILGIADRFGEYLYKKIEMV